MCGIAGIIQSSPGFYTGEHVQKMTDILSHRGPDGEGYWQNRDGTALFGHRRLSIIDLSDSAAQPMLYAERYTIIHNGELYNYIELKEELKKKGYQFRTQSDTEVMLAAYDHYKSGCVDHFDGMFAFAIWDETEKELFAARDRFGEKPFFYSFSEGRLVFASEMKAIWEAGIERKPNLKMVFNFITIGYTDNPSDPSETFFNDIYKLPAASCLYYKPHQDELIIEKYWDIDPDAESEKITAADAVERFNQLFKQSIKRRFRSDTAIGTSLSGGLDSSSIIAFSNELNEASNSHKCFTAIFPGFEKDEKEYAEQVAGHFNLQHHTVTMSADGMAHDLETLMYHQEEPFGSASIYAQYKVYGLAAEHKIKSLLDGQGADEVLAGYPKYYKWYWQELFRRRQLIHSKELKYAQQNGVTEKFGFNNIVASIFPDIASVFLERRYLLNALQHEDLTKEFTHSQSKEAYYTKPAFSGLNGALYFNTCIHGLEELLRYADRNSMAHGCEVRLPFLDHRLVEFIFSLPSELKIKEGWTKWILRSTVTEKLPHEIVWRKNKIGFEPPQQQWMQNKIMQELIHEARKKLVTEKILHPDIVNKPVKAAASYTAANYDWRYLMAGLYL
jgi:asparagine synthase (glutamine-hydrolysing)